MNKKSLAFFLFFSFYLPFVYCQDKKIVLEEIVGVVGSEIILQSEIDGQIIQMKAQGEKVTPETPCDLMEILLTQKLLLHQAKIDSVEVGESIVEMQLDSRLKYFINMIGSKEKLEDYFKKSLTEIKEDLRKQVREQLITQKMQGKISGDITITPSEVATFFKSLDKDSIPYVNSQVELKQIVLYPSYNESSIFFVKEKLLELRKRINDGEKFSTLAKLYSEDPGSAKNGGELGFFSKGDLDPEYAKAAFSLKEGQISKIVESQFGFHIIQLIERKDEKVNTRHILIKPKASQTAIADAQNKLDSIINAIRMDSLTFDKAATRFSQDKSTNRNGGLMLNPRDQSSHFELDQLPTADFYVVKDLAVGQISEAYMTIDENQKQVIKIVMLVSRTLPHKANMNDDYQLIEQLALQNKQMVVQREWIIKKLKNTYLRIDDKYRSCDFEIKNWLKP